MKLKVKKLKDKAIIPRYVTGGAAAFDPHACLDKDVVLKPGEFKIIPTGIAIEIPEGYEAQVRSRSGLAAKNGVAVLNSPGTIDSDYRGELGVILINHGKDPFTVHHGDRIAQVVIAKVEQMEIVEADELSETERSGGGFGSTGV